MMALTPKRLFLYLCISISLLRPYTLFSRSPLVNKTLIEIYCQERLAIFPHILWCEERVSSHFPSPSSISSHFGCVELAATNFLILFHTLVRAGKSNEKFLTFFQCVECSFPYINSTHAENSLLFPHFFLTFSSHWNFIVYSGFHFSCSKLWTVADAGSFALKLCRMLEKNLSWCALLPNFKKESEKEALFLANPLSSFPPFAGGNFGVPQRQKSTVFCRSLTCRAAPMGYNNVSLGWEYSRVSLSVWPLAVVRPFTDELTSTYWTRNASFFLLIAFSVTAVKQAKFAAAKNFYCCAYAKLVCYAIERFLAAWWKFVCRTRLTPFFQNVFFVWFYLERLL